MIHVIRSPLGLATLSQQWEPAQGAASTHRAKFWSGSDASGHGFWDSPSVSEPGAKEWPAAHAGSGLEINPHAGKLVLGLRRGGAVKLLSKTTGECCSVASLTSPRASSPSAIGIALSLVLEGIFLTCLSLAAGMNCFFFKKKMVLIFRSPSPIA